VSPRSRPPAALGIPLHSPLCAGAALTLALLLRGELKQQGFQGSGRLDAEDAGPCVLPPRDGAGEGKGGVGSHADGLSVAWLDGVKPKALETCTSYTLFWKRSHEGKAPHVRYHIDTFTPALNLLSSSLSGKKN